MVLVYGRGNQEARSHLVFCTLKGCCLLWQELHIWNRRAFRSPHGCIYALNLCQSSFLLWSLIQILLICVQVNEFVKLGGHQLVPYYADILGAILPAISDKEEKIRLVSQSGSFRSMVDYFADYLGGFFNDLKHEVGEWADCQYVVCLSSWQQIVLRAELMDLWIWLFAFEKCCPEKTFVCELLIRVHMSQWIWGLGSWQQKQMRS